MCIRDRLYEAIDNLDKAGEKAIKEYWKEKLDLKRSPLAYLLKESDTELVGKKDVYKRQRSAVFMVPIM